MRPTPGPALGPGPTSAWAGPAAAARLWLSYQGNCGAGADESAGLCLCGTAAGGVTVSAQLYIYCISRISMMCLQCTFYILCTTRYVYIMRCAFRVYRRVTRTTARSSIAVARAPRALAFLATQPRS